MRELPVVAEAGTAMSVADLADDELRGDNARRLTLGEEELRRPQQRTKAEAFARLRAFCLRLISLRSSGDPTAIRFSEPA